MESSIEPATKLSALYDIPSELGSRTFVGRDRAMTELAALLGESSRVAIVAASGMGGIGKTELAWQYAVKSRDEGHYAAGIWWLDARSTVVVQLLDKARRMGIQINDQIVNEVERVQDCYGQWLKALDGMALLVFDNVENWAVVSRVFPRDARFKVLVTMREARSDKGVKPLKLDVLLPLDGFRLLYEVSEADERISANPLGTEALCEELGYLPLAIELMGGLLKDEPDSSIEQVRRALADELRAGNLSQVNAAIEVSWVRLSAAERQLMAIVATFGAGAVLWEWVEAVVKGSEVKSKPRGFVGRLLRRKPIAVSQWCLLLDDSAFVVARRRLVALNLLSRSGENLYGLHPLVRSFVREKIKVDRTREAATEIAPGDAIDRIFAQVMTDIAKTIDRTGRIEMLNRVRSAIPHLAEATTHTTLLEKEGDRIWSFTGLAWFYEGQSLWQEAEPWKVKCLEFTKTHFGDRHPDTASSLNNLAALYRLMGQYDRALPLYESALEIRKSKLGNRHPDTASTLNDFALLYKLMGHYDRALPLYKSALKIMKSKLGDQHPDTATSLNNLALLYKSMGQYDRALPLYESALEIRKSELGDRHLDTAQSLNNLAGLYRSMGQYDRTLSLLESALEIRKSELGDRHPDTAQSLNNLAGLYASIGQYDRALPLYESVFSLLEELLGNDHPNTKVVQENLRLLREKM